MSTHSGGERGLLQQLLHRTCQSVQWCGATGASATSRIESALAAHSLHVWTPEVELRAQLTDGVALVIAVRVRAWSDSAEAALSRALDEDRSLMAQLVRAEWKLVRTACRAADRTTGRLLLLTTIPDA